jgi:hypothetical protein
MRTYALAIATAAALFATTPAAFSQEIELGPGGVGVEPFPIRAGLFGGDDVVRNCAEPASIRRSWASRARAIVAGTVTTAEGTANELPAIFLVRGAAA